jgi:hypothetical protein
MGVTVRDASDADKAPHDPNSQAEMGGRIPTGGGMM